MDKKVLKEIIIYASIILFVVLLRTFIVTPVIVEGASMDTTLHNNELMFLNKISYRFEDIKRFDIVVIKLNNEYIIKRVIGLPNEHLEYKDDVLYINGKTTEEYFKNQSTRDFTIESLGYEKIPKNCYFVLGDNRSVSLDSRVLGCFDKSQILGKANFVFYPFRDFGYKK